jgi:uncharacterized membrane protein required for colicin V production
MVYDLIVLGILILCVVIGSIVGAARMIARVAVSFVSYLLAAWLGGMLAGWFFDSVIAPSTERAITDAVSQLAADGTARAAEALPAWLSSMLNLSGTDITAALGGLPSQAAATVNATIRPLVVGVLSLLLTLLLFLVVHFLLSHFAVKPILALFELPGIHGINRFFGALLGVIEAFVIVCILASLLKLVLPYIESRLTIFNESTIYNSFIFYHFYSGNIFTMLLGWIGIKQNTP